MANSHPAGFKPVAATPLDAWRGQASLATAFWGYGVAVSLALIAVFVAALMQGDAALQQTMIGLFAIYTAWVLVAVWRCAETARHPWGIMARLLTIAWVANSVLVLGFLQVRLLQPYLAG